MALWEINSDRRLIKKRNLLKLFDRKFGKNFLASIPALPGVYRVSDPASQVIYVGKAKNLRRRLGQYRNAKRCKKHRKMKKVIQEASRIEVEVCSTEQDATLLEARLIQELRPQWNQAGAFYFLYPLIGMKKIGEVILFCYTTQPELFADFELYGAYRSRSLTREAFFALMELLPFVGHRLNRASLADRKLPKYSYLVGFRQLPSEFWRLWNFFLRGHSKEALEALVFSLVENAGARKNPKSIQDCLNTLSRFWRHEALPLERAIRSCQYRIYPVPQKDRDIIFIYYRFKISNPALLPQPQL